MFVLFNRIIIMNLKIIILISSLSVISAQLNTHTITFRNAPELEFRIQHQAQNTTHLSYSILRNSIAIHDSEIYQNFGASVIVTATQKGFLFQGDDSSLQFTAIEDTTTFSMVSVDRISTGSYYLRDCFELNTDTSWYGGPEQRYQLWPIEKLSFTDYPYVTKEIDYCALVERYWLNSQGLFVFIEKEAPLFIDQTAGSQLCFVNKKAAPYYTHNGSSFTFNYKIGIGSDSKVAHMKAVERFLGKPTDYPDERMTAYPIWSTWAQYRKDIDAVVVQQFADDIIRNGFNNSQIEIDDMWETCYGSLQFDTNKFPNIKSLTDVLKAKGFRITLWVHPFINKGCDPYYNEALSRGYLVLNHNGSPDTTWWNSEENQASHIDFTKPEAAQWFVDRLRTLQAISGIDSFKFDAGESSRGPSDPVLNATFDTHPNALTVEYINTVVPFGPLIEIRTAYSQQNIPVFIRMQDKDSDWTWINGLPTLVTTPDVLDQGECNCIAIGGRRHSPIVHNIYDSFINRVKTARGHILLLQMNMVGYPFVLPDMIGGNGYGDDPIKNKEIYIRWLQANVFMPSLQFSFVPWGFDNETIVIARKFTALHAEYADTIINRFKLAVESGDPVNPPIWWISPNDRTAQIVNNQFLLGEDILVAPVLEEGKVSRNVYLPQGKWTDQNDGSVHQGPVWLYDYPAPLDVLPYFIRSSSATSLFGGLFMIVVSLANFIFNII